MEEMEMMVKNEILDTENYLIELEVMLGDDYDTPYGICWDGTYRWFNEKDLNLFIKELQRMKRIHKIEM
jgi:hypothetical protein